MTELAEQDGKAAEQPVAPAAAPQSRYQRWRERRRNRVSKWDRAPDPKDWRYFVGGLGKVLITTGLLMFGFVAYQLWGTGIETARAQNKLENQFEEMLATSETTTTDTPVVTAPPATEPPVATAPDTVPIGGASTVPPATEPAPPSTVEQVIPPIERGDAIAKLEIPKIGKVDGHALYVVPGVDLTDLKKGPGHYPDTPLPGQLGNASIAGHRTTYGEPFRHIDELDPGDEIIVTMLTGDRFVYAVTSTEIVGPDDYHVVTTTDPTVAMLTLTSCDPVYTARNRIAVHALLKSEESAAVGAPTYYELDDIDEADAGVTLDEPAVEPSDTAETPTAEDSSAVAEPSGDSSGESLVPATTPPHDEVQDAFSEGWFHDSSAWPQIALWGAALILIAFCVRKISRHFRHDSIGILVGIVPFVVCLYFFYQNVNRLLPPGF